MAEPPNVRLYLSSKPENVLLVREMLAGVAEAVDLHREDLDDIRTAVTEASNNVAVHAYGGNQGPLEVEVYAHSHALEVVVRDRGIGIAQRAGDEEKTSPGLGLPVIWALAHHVEFTDVKGSGTEVRMEFSTPDARLLDLPAQNGHELPIVAQTDPATALEITIAPTHLARTVLPRVLSALAVNANFSTDRISDVLLLAHALVAQALESIGKDHFSVSVSAESRNLRLLIGPLSTGGTRGLLEDCPVGGLGSMIEKLVDNHWVSDSGSREVLTVQMTDQR